MFSYDLTYSEISAETQTLRLKWCPRRLGKFWSPADTASLWSHICKPEGTCKTPHHARADISTRTAVQRRWHRVKMNVLPYLSVMRTSLSFSLFQWSTLQRKCHRLVRVSPNSSPQPVLLWACINTVRHNLYCVCIKICKKRKRESRDVDHRDNWQSGKTNEVCFPPKQNLSPAGSIFPFFTLCVLSIAEPSSAISVCVTRQQAGIHQTAPYSNYSPFPTQCEVMKEKTTHSAKSHTLSTSPSSEGKATVRISFTACSMVPGWRTKTKNMCLTSNAVKYTTWLHGKLINHNFFSGTTVRTSPRLRQEVLQETDFEIWIKCTPIPADAPFYG